jgi:D-galactose 1-dehydrogenase
MNSSIGIGIVGFGKIAREQHVPALRAHPDFRLLAITSREPVLEEGIRSFTRLDDMMRGVPELHAVAFCMPAQGRYELVAQALDHGLHVLLEKPPGATVSEVITLRTLAARKGVSIFTSWHSRHGAAVDAARDWLANRSLQRAHIEWKEDVRKWHPGQEWIWQAGGLGVFDPGINALSLVTHLLPNGLFVKQSALKYPLNRAMPIAASVKLSDGTIDVTAEFDFRHSGAECWNIELHTGAGWLRLENGGATLTVDGVSVPASPNLEYAGVYRRFEHLIRNRESDVDVAPLQLVADAFLVSKGELAPPFDY